MIWKQRRNSVIKRLRTFFLWSSYLDRFAAMIFGGAVAHPSVRPFQARTGDCVNPLLLPSSANRAHNSYNRHNLPNMSSSHLSEAHRGIRGKRMYFNHTITEEGMRPQKWIRPDTTLTNRNEHDENREASNYCESKKRGSAKDRGRRDFNGHWYCWANYRWMDPHNAAIKLSES